MIRLKENYQKKVIPYFHSQGYKNKFSVPKIEKVIINIGLGSLLKAQDNQKELIEVIKKEISLITGQIPYHTKGRTSIAGFGTRKGQLLGLKVTLRSFRMIDFLERLINIALPRSKDFGGISEKSFDSAGNLTIGIKDYAAFPEASSGSFQKIKKALGFEITIATNTSSKEEGIALLRELGFPLSVSQSKP